MSTWTAAVKCKHCEQRNWSVVNGSWTCVCGQPMHDPRERSPRCESPKREPLCTHCNPDHPCDPDCRICWSTP